MRELSIQEIQIIPVKPRNGLIGFFSCTINNQLSLNDIAIHSCPDGSGFRLVYPRKTLANGKILNTFFPINKSTGQALEQAVTIKLNELLEKSGERHDKEVFGEFA